uniref:Ig-like domain-containing protein n=1 Tax=Myripristis murdjan TaxID=586833 RepID=A0A667WR14_9TELE
CLHCSGRCCSLSVLIPPTFIKKLMNVQEIWGSVVTMECKVAGSLPMSVEWTKGSRKITTSSKHKLSHVDNTVSLELKLAESGDTGEYSCKVMHLNLVSLWVLVPPSFVAEPEPQAVFPKSTVHFRSIFQGTPPFTVKWFKDDSELVTGPTCTLGLEKYSSTLELHSVGPLQDGIYSCQVSNEAGTVKSAAELLVKGVTILFFYGDNYKIMFADSTAYLQLRTTKFEDNGVYTCEAHNDAGSASCSTILTVQGQLLNGYLAFNPSIFLMLDLL